MQEELDDILRYGAMELFSEKDEEAKARQIHYDDAAIDRSVFLCNVADFIEYFYILFTCLIEVSFAFCL